jgi:transcriptional regulator with XRE-family HTH domain
MKKDPISVLGERIREHRLRLNLSQEDLADVAGLHRTYIGAVERGERNISFINILKIAKAIEIDPGELLKGLGR